MAAKLGDMLVSAGLLTAEQLKTALAEQKRVGGRLGTNLVKLGFLSEDEITQFLQKQYGVSSINLSDYNIDQAILDLVPSELATKYRCIPLERRGKVLTVAMVNPADVLAIEDIKFTTGFEVKPVVAAESSIVKAIEEQYQAAGMLDEVMKDIGDESAEVEVVQKTDEEEDEMTDLAAAADSAPVVKLVNSILLEAVDRRVSDIHIEPYEKELRIRFRIDGILHEVMHPPYRMRKAIVSRLKIMSKLKISEKRLPQDGRIKIRIKGRPVDLRVSTVPTLFGEKMALRILDRTAVSFDLVSLGFEREPMLQFIKGISSPYGIVLVTGPTGCGKTTTLYAAINKINAPDVNITTAEDPVEYSLLGINQVQMKASVGLTFASALRSYLRQDPDIIMVGEIRDKETAEISIRASLTGHLVLSSVHTNNAAGTVTRLVNMGVEPFLVASTMNCIESQRLLRKVCQSCKEPMTPNPALLKDVGIDPSEFEGFTLYKGKGCRECNNTGYRGRLGIFEVMAVSSDIRELILDRAPTDALAKAAKDGGMTTLREAAIKRAKEGVTDIFEVIKETSQR
ncbi:type IV-A pilus assembly ATPase PilB [candidate division TA06 bacterium]|uniref:Type IV-A pilus assembly ATPase PilB n=1 Tax=candidate division TA06 bacterium TaxID=2250710 RepID=A0A523UN16_UNCT6|nr:MAG: type IV-A pilus assembly ATPase PilB [candidate division TA06 bacterium]